MSRQTGNRYENEFCRLAEIEGYATFPARGSRGPVDVLCFAAQPHPLSSPNTVWYTHDLVPLVVQVGTTKKPIAATLAELDAALRPIGSLCVVARRHRAKNRRIRWTFHTAEGKAESLAALLRHEVSVPRNAG